MLLVSFKSVRGLLFSFFFLTRSLIDRCQIVTDNHKINVSSLLRSLLNHSDQYIDKNVMDGGAGIALLVIL